MDTMENAPSDSNIVKISLPWKWRPVKRRMLPGCELFMDGDAAMQIARKLIPLEVDGKPAEDTEANVTKEAIPCCAVGCLQTFTSLLSYENHYNSVHRHTCQKCHRTFPSPFLLDIHIQENHDPLFALLVSRQNMYQCLVESCGQKFRSSDKRRQHMIKIHCYPANFRFHRLTGADAQHRKKPTQPSPAARGMEVDNPRSPPIQTEKWQADAHPSSKLAASHACPTQSESPSDKENTTAGSKTHEGVGESEEDGMEVSEAEKGAPRRVFVHKVPQNFSFGHGVSRSFQRPPGKKKTKKKGGHWHQRVDDSTGETTTNIANVDMKDMADALSEAL